MIMTIVMIALCFNTAFAYTNTNLKDSKDKYKIDIKDSKVNIEYDTDTIEKSTGIKYLVEDKLKEEIDIKDKNKKNKKSEEGSEVISTITSTQSDLRIYDMKVKSGVTYPFTAEGTGSIEYTIANYSDYDSGDVTVGLKVNGNLVYTFSAGNIPAWTGYIRIINLNGFSEGDYNIELIADVNNLISETIETNNSDSGVYTWVGTPDLVATELTAEGTSTYEVGTGIDFHLRVDNDGTGVAIGETTIYITLDGTPIQGWIITDFPRNAYFQKDFQLTFNEVGNYQVGIVVDQENQISELNENNNSIIKNYEITTATKVEVTGNLTQKIYEYWGDTPSNIPVEGIKVKIIDDDVIFNDVLDTVYTDATGNFSAIINNQTSESGCDIFLEIELDNSVVVVKDLSLIPSIYSWKSATHKDFINPKLDFGSINISDKSTALDGAMNIFYWINYGNDFYKSNSYTGNQPTKVTLRWEDGVGEGSYQSGTSIYMNGSSSDKDQYDTSIVFHEYGHFIMKNESVIPSGTLRDHGYTTPSNYATGYSEGYAHFLSCAIRNDDEIRDYTSTSTYYGVDLENCIYIEDSYSSQVPVQSTYLDNGKMEAMAGAALHDICDTHNDGYDTYSLLMKVVDHIMRGEHQSIHEFYTDFFAKGYAQGKEEGMWKLFNDNNVAYDINEPSVTITETSPLNFTGTATDDVKVQKIEWLLDGVVVKTVYSTSPGIYTVPSSTSGGTHTIAIKAYDLEGLYRGSEIRTNAYGIASITFNMPQTTITSDISYIDKAFEEQEIDVERKSSHKVKASVDNTKNKFKKNKTIIEFSINEQSDIVIDGFVDGAIDYIKVIDENNKTITKSNHLIRGEGFKVNDLPFGDYKAEIKTKDSKENRKYFINIYSKPCKPVLKFEKLIRQKSYSVMNGFDSEMIIEVNGDITSILPSANKTIDFKEGENQITYYLVSGDIKSDKVVEKIYVDTTNPVIEIKDTIIKGERLIINGRVSEGLRSLEVNGEKIMVGEFRNNFAYITKFDKNVTSYTIVAEDYAGNVTSQEVVIH